MKKKAIINTLKICLLGFFIIFSMVFISIKFFGPGDTIQPGSAPRKYKNITFKETLDHLPFIISFSLGGALIIGFLLFYPRELQEQKKLAELKRKEEKEISEKKSEDKPKEEDKKEI